MPHSWNQAGWLAALPELLSRLGRSPRRSLPRRRTREQLAVRSRVLIPVCDPPTHRPCVRGRHAPAGRFHSRSKDRPSQLHPIRRQLPLRDLLRARQPPTRRGRPAQRRIPVHRPAEQSNRETPRRLSRVHEDARQLQLKREQFPRPARERALARTTPALPASLLRFLWHSESAPNSPAQLVVSGRDAGRLQTPPPLFACVPASKVLHRDCCGPPEKKEQLQQPQQTDVPLPQV